MKTVFAIALMLFLPAMAMAQRESIKSSNKLNSAAMRVPDKEKEKATAEKFNGQKPDRPQKPKPRSGKQAVQGATENGNRVKTANKE
ncbi:hypothetical protein [Spirosoma arcticum]